MAVIHPTSTVHPQAELADDVVIGPGCVIEGPVRIGPGTRLIGQVWLVGRVRIGANNVLYPHVCIGFEPQDRKYDSRKIGAGVVIGDNNIIREDASIHRATGERPTTLGNDNYVMCYAHLGHDAVVGSRCTLANGATLGGHAVVADQVILGGNATIHQFVRLGRLSMISGLAGVSQDVPPFCTVYNIRRVESLNLVGLRRAGYRQHITPLQRAFRILYRSRHTVPRALELISSELAHDPLVNEMVQFIRASKRGITGYRPTRGIGGACEIQPNGDEF